MRSVSTTARISCSSIARPEASRCRRACLTAAYVKATRAVRLGEGMFFDAFRTHAQSGRPPGNQMKLLQRATTLTALLVASLAASGCTTTLVLMYAHER